VIESNGSQNRHYQGSFGTFASLLEREQQEELRAVR
jgi:hypothetical protein